jgi:hypothetical protein
MRPTYRWSMLSQYDVKKATIRGSDESGFMIQLAHFQPGNFGQKRLAMTILPERFQRHERARAHLDAAGVPDNRIVLKEGDL